MSFDIKNENELVETKDQVINLIGSYYGNPIYRYAIGKWRIKDLIETKELLDEINMLGYNYASLHRLTDHADIRFMPILISHYDKADSDEKKICISNYMMHKEYSKYTASICERYIESNSSIVKFSLSNVLYQLRNRNYIQMYLKLVNSDDYIGQNDLLPKILCGFHVKEFSQRLLDLYIASPEQMKWNFARYSYMIGTENYIPYLSVIAKSNDRELCKYAQKSIAVILSKG